MKKLLKTLLNNGFFVLALLIAVTLYLAYGQKQSAQNAAYVSPHEESADIAAPHSSSSGEIAQAPAQNSVSPAPTEETPPATTDDVAAVATKPEEQAAESEAAVTKANTDTPTATETAAPEQTAGGDESADESAVEAGTDTTTTTDVETHKPAAEQAAQEAEQPSAAAIANQAQPAPQGERNGDQNDTAEMASDATESESTPASTHMADPASETPAATAHESSTQLNDGATEVRVQTATSEHDGQHHSEVHVQVNQPPARPADNKAAASRFDPHQINDRAILSYFSSPREALAAAREAAQKGDYVWSAAIYSSLLKPYPRADLAGELGNVLWRMGEKQWAHRAWRYAAQLLIREGRIDIARTFARNIAKVDPALSREIEAHLPPMPSDKPAPEKK